MYDLFAPGITSNSLLFKEKIMKRIYFPVLAAIALMLVVGLTTSSTASAGEVGGPPGPDGAEGGDTPIGGFWTGDGAASICSFSGLNDVIINDPEDPHFEPTQTQSYGTFLVLIKNLAGVKAKDAKQIMGESPADTCNPNAAPFGNPKK
jgi:hypothetical protein